MNTTVNNAEIKVFSLFNQSGKLEEIKPVKNLPLYCKVYMYGFGMSDCQGAITSGPDQFGNYQVVKMSDYTPGFDTLDRYSRPHSKKFGIGIYFDDNMTTWPEAEVKKYISLAEIAEAKEKVEAEAKDEADKREIEELPGRYPHLTVNKNDDHKVTKMNLVADLKKNFPGVKFSVKKEHYDTYSASWVNGPSTEEVEKITGKYEDHVTDMTGDYRDYEPSNFNRVFGGFKYLFENRSFSSEIDAMKSEFIELANYRDERDSEMSFYRLCRKTSFAPGASNFKIERTEKTCGSLEDFFKITYEVDQAPASVECEKIEGLQLVDYSEKAVALFGDTKAIKDTLKEMGGRFNFYLSLNGTKTPGWVF